jgi:serralysin
MANYGTDFADLIVDGAGTANIAAGGGNDFIIAANEHNTEWIDGGDGFDTISYVNLYGIDVDLSASMEGYGYAIQTLDILTSIENVIGSKGDDTLLGTAGANEFFGLAGDDLLEGRGGADKLDGGAGFDTASYSRATTGVEIWTNLGKGFGGEAQGDRLSGIERVIGSSHHDFMHGDSGRNTFEGGGGGDDLMGISGNDRLDGGAGADRLVGGLGADRLTGGSGADLFRYFEVGDSFDFFAHLDTITDFNHSNGDQIDLELIDAKANTSGLQAFQFIGDDVFTAAGQVRVYAEDGDMIVEANTSGSGGAEMSILVADIVDLGASDFIL